MSFIDYLLAVIALIIGMLFVVAGENRIYKFYLGAIIGFLVFLVLNMQLQIITGLRISELNSLQIFFVKKPEFVLTLSTLSIPILGFIFMLHDGISITGAHRKSASVLFALFLPFFLLGIFGYVRSKSFVHLNFLLDILSPLKNSWILHFFEKNTHLIFILIVFLLFHKILFAFFYSLALLIFEKIYTAVHGEEDDEEVTEEETRIVHTKHFE